MGTMFDQEWLSGFSARWNSTPEMTEPLGQAKFCSVIGFGYKDDEHPRVAFQVQDGKIVNTSLVHSGGAKFDWDLRAAPEQWEEWRRQPLTIMSLGPAVAQGKIQFKTGDYRAMIRQMQLAKPFLHLFSIL